MHPNTTKPALIGTALALMTLVLDSSPARAHAVAVGGTSTIVDTSVSTAFSWQTLLQKTFTFSNEHNFHQCVAVASADATNPKSGVSNQYRFTIAIDDLYPATNGGSERVLEFDDNASTSDPDVASIATEATFIQVPIGSHTVRLLARKVDSGDATLTVQDASLSVICTKARLIPPAS